MTHALSSACLAQIDDEANHESHEDSRLYRRFEIALNGRCMAGGTQEFPCRVRDISVGGASLAVTHDVARSLRAGETVVAYIDQLGGLQGSIICVGDDAFTFALIATRHKREKLASQLTWLLNAADLRVAARRHDRIKVSNRNATLTLGEGGFAACFVLDVSVSGASIACKARPELGEEVWLSRLRGRVVRHHVEGIGIQFMEMLDPDHLQIHFV